MTRLGLGAIVAALLLAALGSGLFKIKTIGSPNGNSARIGETIITMMSRLEPYAPTLHRNPANDRYTIGLLLHSARDSAARQFVPIIKGQRAVVLPLVKITAVEGNLVWYRAPDVGAYDIARWKFLADEPGWSAAPQAPAKPVSHRDLATGEQAVLNFLIAGGHSAPDRWIGVLSEAEAASDFPPGSTIVTSYPVQRTREPRRLYTTIADRVEDKTRVRQLEPLGDDGMLNAAFLRVSPWGEILRLTGSGFLMLYESQAAATGPIMAARIDGAGKTVWQTDTGIGELWQILPDSAFPALIGSRPRMADKVSEPILVVIDAMSGQVAIHSLWLK